MLKLEFTVERGICLFVQSLLNWSSEWKFTYKILKKLSVKRDPLLALSGIPTQDDILIEKYYLDKSLWNLMFRFDLSIKFTQLTFIDKFIISKQNFTLKVSITEKINRNWINLKNHP